jgi:hypothetical protein
MKQEKPARRDAYLSERVDLGDLCLERFVDCWLEIIKTRQKERNKGKKMGLYGYPSCAERASSFLRTPTVWSDQILLFVNSTDLADDENSVVIPTTTRVILHLHVRNLHCCTYSRLEFFGSDWHGWKRGDGYVVTGDDQIRSPITSDTSRAPHTRGISIPGLSGCALQCMFWVAGNISNRD